MKKLNFKKIISLVLAISCFTALIPNVLAQDSEDYTLRTAAVQRFQKSNNGAIYLGRWYAGPNRIHINEGGNYSDGQIFQFEIPENDLEYLESAKIYIKAVRGGGQPLFIHKYSTATAPEIPELDSNGYTVKNQADIDAYSDFLAGFTSIEQLKSAENVVNNSEPTQANWVSFDLMKKDDQGDPYITLASGDLTVAVGSAKTSITASNDTLVMGENAQGFVNSDPQDVSFNNCAGLAYIELKYNKDSVRIEIAQDAVDLIEPYVQGEINDGNAETVRSLLDDASLKVAGVKSQAKKEEFQAVIDAVKEKLTMYELGNADVNELDDVTVEYVMNNHSLKTNSGNVYFNKTQGGSFGIRQPINDSGLFWKGLFLHFSEIDTNGIDNLIGSVDEVISSANLYVYAYNEESNVNEKLYISEYSKDVVPTVTTTGNGGVLQVENEKNNFNNFYDGFTALGQNIYSDALGVDTASQPKWVSIDLLQKNGNGNRLIGLELDKPLNLLLRSNDPQLTNIVFADDYKPYIEITYSREPLRIHIAQTAVDQIAPFVQGEINDGNVADVRSLLDDASLKVAGVKSQAEKEEFQAVIDAVRANLAMYEIEGLREEPSVLGDFTLDYDLENPIDLTEDRDYYVGFDISLVDELEDSQEISFALNNTVFKIKADGVYLNDVKSEVVLDADNFVVIKMSGTNAFVYLNGEKILTDTVSDNEINSLVIANNCEEKIDSIENITIETCFEGYGSSVIAKVNELESNYDTLANDEFFELYEEANDAITSLGTSILAKNIPLQLDFSLNKRVDDKIDEAINSNDYGKLLLVKELIDMYDEPLKTALMDKYNAQESYFDDKTPTITSAQINKIDDKLSVEYVIEDTYKNASNEVTIEWYLNGTQKIGDGEKIDIEVEHRGEQVCAKITPKNIKGVNGATFTTANFEIPQLSDGEVEDYISKIAAVQRFQKSTSDAVYIGRWYTNPNRMQINDAGYYPDGQFFRFEIPQKDFEYLESAKIYIKAVRGGEKPLFIHKYSTADAPEITGISSNGSITNQDEQDSFSDFVSGFVSIDSSDYLYSAENVADNGEDLTVANWVSFDLMKKNKQGNPYITLTSGDVTIAVHSAKNSNMATENNTLVMGVNVAGFVNPDPQGVVFDDKAGLAYIELKYNKDSVRIKNAQVAVNKLEPYVDGEITSGNKATVRSLLDAAAAKVALITDESQKSQLQKTIDAVETKYNIFEISDLRQTIVVPDDLPHTLTTAFDLTQNKEYYAKFTTELNAPLADAENVTFNLGNVSFGIDATGVWLNGESAQLDYGEKPELLVMITKDGAKSIATLFVNDQDVLEVEIQETLLTTVDVEDNTTDKINDIEDVVAEICPADYAKDAIASVEAFEASLEATDDQFKNQYTKTATSVSRLGDSLINELLSQRVLNNWAIRINSRLAVAVEKKDYSIVEEVKDTIAGISNIALKDALLALCVEPEATFNNLVPEIAYASITGNVAVGKTISVSYTIKDTYKNASDDVVIKWILNDRDEIETGSELVISSLWKGKRIKAVVTPKNNKGTLGKNYTTVSVKVPDGGDGGNGGTSWSDVITDSTLNQEPSTIPPQKLAFSDIANSWAKNDIMALYEKGYIKGISEDKFGPDNSMTRAEFVTLLLRILGISEESYNNAFEDVKAGDWYANAVGTAFSKGFINGKGNGFMPNDKVTRQEAAKIIAVAKNLKSKAKDTSFTDNDSISQWAKNYVAVVQETGLITGYPDGSFGPQKNITRAESVIIFLRVLDL